VSEWELFRAMRLMFIIIVDPTISQQETSVRINRKRCSNGYAPLVIKNEVTRDVMDPRGFPPTKEKQKGRHRLRSYCGRDPLPIRPVQSLHIGNG
jgi:hypothetical protein